jgi:AcrR family transcriptional regulator
MTDQESTQGKLLEAACEVFAQKGFRDATIAEICEKAGANIAAVNYHFGDKERLYAEAWRLAFQRALEAYPPDEGVAADAGAEDRLKAFVLSVLNRIFDRGSKGHFSKILFSELGNPTAALKDVVKETIRPQRKRLVEIVREIMGPGSPDDRADLCAMSVINQCLAIGLNMPAREQFLDRNPDVEAIADHITRFSIAGIREISGK